MDGKVTIQDESVLCGTCRHCGTGLDNECKSSPESKVLDCPDYERKLSDIFKNCEQDLKSIPCLCSSCLMRETCNLNTSNNKGLSIGSCLYYTPENKGQGDDKVNHPSHYTQGGIECIDCIRASMPPEGFQDYCKGNIIKYIFRWRFKGGVEDLRKAQVYLNWLIESAENGEILHD